MEKKNVEEIIQIEKQIRKLDEDKEEKGLWKLKMKRNELKSGRVKCGVCKQTNYDSEYNFRMNPKLPGYSVMSATQVNSEYDVVTCDVCAVVQGLVALEFLAGFKREKMDYYADIIAMIEEKFKQYGIFGGELPKGEGTLSFCAGAIEKEQRKLFIVESN
jgi:hypothetical protein